MIIDISAIIAIILRYNKSDSLLQAMASADRLYLSVGTWIELGVVQDRRMTAKQRDLTNRFITTLGAELVPVSIAQATIAREAHRRYGPGSGSLVRLNLGDCFSYALARDLNLPLLFVGEDFSHTDVLRVEM